MVVSLKANRKRIIAFLLLAVIVAGACFLLRGGDGNPEQQIAGGTNEARVSYLQSFGWQVAAEATETREVMIPAQFNDVYTAYNVMQQAQGFDLKPHAGEICTQYKYKVENYPGETEVYATLLVYAEKIIGGDIACAKVDGFMHGFAPNSARYGETAAKGNTSSIAETSSSAAEGATVSEPAAVTSSVPSDNQTDAQLDASAEEGAEEVINEDAYPTD